MAETTSRMPQYAALLLPSMAETQPVNGEDSLKPPQRRPPSTNLEPHEIDGIFAPFADKPNFIGKYNERSDDSSDPEKILKHRAMWQKAKEVIGDRPFSLTRLAIEASHDYNYIIIIIYHDDYHY